VLTWQQIQEKADDLEIRRRAFVAELTRAGHDIPDALQVSPAAALERADA
jgi:hypothetical protein